jgi:hypothetical protein
MANLSAIVEQLRNERKQVEKQLSALNAALAAFVGVYTGSSKRQLSAEARKKISLAQKARWAKRAATKGKKPGVHKRKRAISAAGRQRIAAAQRARWAKAKGNEKAV